MEHNHRFINKEKIISVSILICTVFLMYAGAALQMTDSVSLVGVPSYASNMKDISQIKDVNGAIEQKLIEKENEEYNTEAKKLYEAFLNMELAGSDYIYTYVDYDEDGKIELCLLHNEKSEGNVVEYKDCGLQYKYLSDTSGVFDLNWQWSDVPDYSKDSEKMTHLGMYVYVSEKEYGEDNFWYLDKASFLEGNGFTDQSPYFEYFDENGNSLLTLYYDEQTKHGCGIRYYERDPSTFETTGMYGFTFTGTKKGDWEGTPDYFKLESVYGGTGENSVDEYQEKYEYDEDGRIIHYVSTGLCDWYEESERLLLLHLDFTYDENGRLEQRYYQHGSWLFGTGYTVWECYFDGQERIEYEYIYITHGHIENYFIYSGNSEKPEYVLMLDCNMGQWIPEFTEY